MTHEALASYQEILYSSQRRPRISPRCLAVFSAKPSTGNPDAAGRGFCVFGGKNE